MDERLYEQKNYNHEWVYNALAGMKKLEHFLSDDQIWRRKAKKRL